MAMQVEMPSRLARFARVALTFLLVFGLSFHVEMALAAPGFTALTSRT